MSVNKIFVILFCVLFLFSGTVFAQEGLSGVVKQSSEAKVKKNGYTNEVIEYPDVSTGGGYYGETGLWRVTSSEPLKSLSLRLSIHGEWFYFKEFLIKNDTTQRQVGDLSLGVVPYNNLELFVLYQTFSTYNDKVVPKLQLSQGNITLGLKYAYPFLKYLSTGALIAFTLNTKPGDSTYSLGSTGYILKSITTFDGKGVGLNFLRVHLNLGGYLIPDKAFGEDLYIYSHYLLNINEQRQFLFGFALDFPLRKERLLPFVEVSLGYPDGPGYASGGIKYQPFERLDLTFDLVTEFGIFRGTPRYAPTTQQYNIVAGIGYGVKPTQKIKVVKEKVVEKVCDESCKKVPEIATGLAKGFVYEEGSETPVGNAIVIMEGTGLTNLATDPLYGDFTTPPIVPGKYNFSIIKDGYEPVMSIVEIKKNEKSVVKFYLKKKVLEGSINVRVIDSQNVPIGNSEISAISGDKQINIPKAPDGIYSAKLPAGKWYVVAKAENKLSSGKIVEVISDKSSDIELQLKDRPKATLIIVEKDKITLKKKIQFAKNSAKIMGNSFVILDMVVDAINSNLAKIKKVNIEGHTDNTGNREKNIKLSQERAESVKSYLIKAGIRGDILEATGYGPDRPIATNKTSKGREQNRRVEFVIEENPLK